MIRVGTAGWSYDDWQGVVYPARRPRGFHPLAHLARFVDCVEINSSFYAPPRADYAERWLSHTANMPAFRFAAKLQDVFTHGSSGAAPLSAGEAFDRARDRWLAGIEPLRVGGRLVAVLLQFPVTFRHADATRARLALLADRFGHLPLVLEVRHRSWFGSDGLRFIEGLGLSLATIDLPASRDHPPAEVAQVGPIAYLRLHGRNSATWFDPRAGRDDRYDYLYSESELSDLAQRARELAQVVDETFVITNNHFTGKALVNALELSALLEARVPSAPAELVQAYPRLRERVHIAGQRDLFSP